MLSLWSDPLCSSYQVWPLPLPWTGHTLFIPFANALLSLTPPYPDREPRDLRMMGHLGVPKAS